MKTQVYPALEPFRPDVASRGIAWKPFITRAFLGGCR
jgi:hypothetical protein